MSNNHEEQELQKSKDFIKSEYTKEAQSLQQKILERLQDSEDSLSQFNNFSKHSQAAISTEFASHAETLKSLKSEMDIILKRVFALKVKLKKHYPSAFAEAMDKNAHKKPSLD